MRTFADCIPCFTRQALESARFATDDTSVHERVVREVEQRVGRMDPRTVPPKMGQIIHRLIRELTGDADPYRGVKDRFNRFALELLPGLREKVRASADPLVAALRLAIAGNIIDFGVRGDLADEHVHGTIRSSLTAPLHGDVSAFRRAVQRAARILYLADNAGELVFDRLLIEQLPTERVTLAVKGGPVINDATADDARAAGLDDLVEVIDNGSDAPGTILPECSAAFRGRFDAADLVVAKGQGNYETLSDGKKTIFFLLKAKCPAIAKHIGCREGDMVVVKNG